MSLDGVEYDILEYIGQHKEGLQHKMQSLATLPSSLEPSNLRDLYNDLYSEGALEYLRNEAGLALGLNPEQMQVLTIETVRKVFPDLLIPQKTKESI